MGSIPTYSRQFFQPALIVRSAALASPRSAPGGAAVCARQDDRAFAGLLPLDRLYPVRFKTDELSFIVPGRSGVMPYDSTRRRDLSDEDPARWRRTGTGDRGVIQSPQLEELTADLAKHSWAAIAGRVRAIING